MRRGPAVRSVIEEHAGEAAFLWRSRDTAASGPSHTREELAAIDARLAIQLDGLRVAHDAAWEVCAEVLPLDKPGDVFVVSALALAVGAYAKLAEVLDAAGLDRTLARGIISALGWTPLAQVRRPLDAFLAIDGPPALRRMGIAGATLHGIDPGAALEDAVASEDPALRARAFRAAGELGRADLLPLLRVGDRDAEADLWQAWGAALLGDAGAVGRLETITCEAIAGGAGSLAAFATIAATLATRAAGVPRALAFVDHVAAQQGGERVGVLAASALGDARSVERLLAALAIPSLARLAAEGLGSILGLDTRSSPLAGSAPDDFTPEDPDPDEALPWPDRGAIERAVRSTVRASGVRYLAGEPLSEAVLRRVLVEGTQRRRIAAALELALLRPGTPLVQVRQRAF